MTACPGGVPPFPALLSRLEADVEAVVVTVAVATVDAVVVVAVVFVLGAAVVLVSPTPVALVCVCVLTTVAGVFRCSSSLLWPTWTLVRLWDEFTFTRLRCTERTGRW